jgi:signal transduction histidine kinase
MLSMVLFSVLVLVSLIAKSITGQLKRIEFVAHNLKLGKTDVKVEITSDDEIGKLARSFNEMARDATNMASLAENIGKGNYETEFEKRSEEDIFGKALLTMRDNLKAKTDELNDNIAQLKEASQYKTDFLANMSHELRTPLNSMLILASLLQENKEENLNDEQLEFIGIIHKSGWNLLDLINGILDLSKIEAGKLGIELMEVNFFKVLDDCYKLFSPVAFENKLEFTVVQMTPIPQMITSDEMRLGQILKNLISNALKFTPSGGSVSLLLNYQNEILELSVVDSGIGIEKDKQDAIFGDFNQADGSTSRNYGGTGLGLSITLNLVELLNGEITLESEKGKGSKFSVYLPLKDIVTKDLKNLPEFKKINQFDKAKVKIVVDNDSLEFEQLQELSFKSKKVLSILLIDSDISNVFQLSADLSSLNIEIEEASTINELKEKNMLDYPVVLVNLKSIETSDLDPILEFLEENDLNVIKIGLGNKITDFSSITALKNEVQKFI